MQQNIKTQEINGAKIANYQITSLEAGYIDIRFNAGSIFDSPETWGALHLLEHMLFTKSINFKDSQLLELYKEENGISSGGWTSNLEMGFWFKFPSISIKEAINLFEQMIFYPVFTEKNLKLEKNIIEQEYRDKYSSPYQRFYREIRKQIYGNSHPYMRDGIGHPENIKNITVDNLKTIHTEFLTAGNMFIGVAGKSSHAKVKKLFQNSTEHRLSGTLKIDSSPSIQPETNYFYHQENVDHVQIHIQWVYKGGKDLSLVERVMVGMARYIIGGSARSRLFKRLRDDLGFVYDTSTTWNWKDNASFFEVYASTSMKNSKKVYEEMTSIVWDFINKPIPEDEFNRARKFMNTQTMLSYDSVSAIAENLSGSLSVYGRVITPEEYVAIASKLNEIDLRNALSKIVNNEVAPYVAVLSKKDPHLVP